MKLKIHQRVTRKIKAFMGKDPDRFLREVSGIIHVGANLGQERDEYEKNGLRVAWVEPIPEVFCELKENVAGLLNQKAYQYLVTDQEGKEYTFHVANNKGASSSIMGFKEHGDLWPKVEITREIKLTSVTLENLVKKEALNMADFQALVMDTQGAELLVLKGSQSLLQHFRFIKTEVPDFESYEGCCTLEDIDEFLFARGFCRFGITRFARSKKGKSYYDVVYQDSREILK